MFDALDHEWTDLTRRRAWTSDYERLATACGIAEYGTADALVTRLHSNYRDDEDEILAALLSARPDRCATRVLLQAFLPTIRRITNDRRALAVEREELQAAVVTAAWERLATYPLETRPTRIAANIALDIRKRVVKYLAEPEAVVSGSSETSAPNERTSDERLVASVTKAVEANLLSPEDATRLLQFEFAERNVVQLAQATRRTWRYGRMQLLEHALLVREHVE